MARLDADVLVVGAGFAGSILAERLAVAGGLRVLLIDQRDHIAGNAYDYVDEHGVLVHKYGPHIFHTNAGKVVYYLSRFTDWRPYEHRVRAWVEGQLVPIPINRTTVNALYGLDLQTDEQVQAFYDERPSRSTSSAPARTRWSRRSAATSTRSSSAATRSSSGTAIRRSCTRRSRRASRRARTPTTATSPTASRRCRRRASRRCSRGWSTTRGSRCGSSTDFFAVRDELRCRHVVFTGPIDRYFDRCYGELPYRSLEFALRTEATPDGGLVQPVGDDQRAGRGGPVHAHDGVPPPHRPAAARLDADRRVPARRGRSLLPDPERRHEGRSTSATRRWRRPSPA